MKHLLLSILIVFTILVSQAQSVFFESPGEGSVFAVGDSTNIILSVLPGIDSVKLQLFGPLVQQYLSITHSNGYFTAKTPVLKQGSYSVEVIYYRSGIPNYTAGGLDFSAVSKPAFCCGLTSYGGNLIGIGGRVYNPQGTQLYFSNSDIDSSIGYIRYNYYSPDISIGSTTNSLYRSNYDYNSASGLSLTSNQSPTFSLSSSSQQHGRYGSAGIYGYSTGAYDDGGSGISFGVSDSAGGSEIDQYSTGIDINARYINLGWSGKITISADSVVIPSLAINLDEDSESELSQRSILSVDQFGDLRSKPFDSYLIGNCANDIALTFSGENDIQTFGFLNYSNLHSSWNIAGSITTDSTIADNNIQIGYPSDNQAQPHNALISQNQYTIDGNTNTSLAELYEYSGSDGGGISLTVTDSTSQDPTNGIQIYSTGIDLNAPKIQLTHFPNDSTDTKYLTTDSVGNILLKSIPSNTSSTPPSFVYDNGLTQNGDEITLGGSSDMDLDLEYVSADGVSYSGYPIYGSMKYSTAQGQWEMYSYFDSDSLNGEAGISTSLQNGNEFYNYNQATINDNYYYASTDIYQYAGLDGAGISLTVNDSSSQYQNNGIQIYSTGIDLNAPKIQFNYFPNTPAMDSVLVTDSVGNLKQRAISSFANGHWFLNGNTTYDTLDNIGIGTINPQSKLAVNGTITAQKVKVTQIGWADYVFDSTYRLPLLSDVHDYIRRNKHLQNIPSAAEVEKNGIDLGTNQVSLLKKIEEMTLYIIEQNKRTDEQDKKIRELEIKLNKLISISNPSR